MTRVPQGYWKKRDSKRTL